MTSEYLTFSLSVFTGFFAIMNPVANVPIFLGLVEGKPKASKQRIAKKATVTAFIIVAVFVIMGKYIFDLFGITIPAFKLTGGILIFFIGFEMLLSKTSQVQNQENIEPDETIAISPLAIPILAGPGTIVTAMNYVTDAGNIKMGIVLLVFFLMSVLTYMAFEISDRIVNKIGNNLIVVISKIMGLILAIIGTGMAIEGVKLAFGLDL